MPAKNRFKTKYPGVYFIEGICPGTGKADKAFYIRYRKAGEAIEEKAGWQSKDDMTAARASTLRGQKISGKEETNKERREAEKTRKEAGAWTISRLWDEYKVNKPNLKGVVSDQNRFDNHIEPAFGKKQPSEILPLDVDRLRLKLLKKKAPGTVKNVLELLRRIINFGINKQLCEGPGFKIEVPQSPALKTEDLTAEQLSKLLEAIDKDSNIQAGNLMKIALYTGMRRGELFKLRWTDIDFDRGFIHIRDPKGGADQKIPLNDGARKVLESHPRTRSKYVFPGRKGRQRTDIKHQVNRIRDAAGLPGTFRALHGLRHVYASMLASSGKVDMYTLQKLLTHKSPIMTQRYAHLRDEALRAASNIAGDIIQEASVKTDKENKVVNLEDHNN